MSPLPPGPTATPPDPAPAKKPRGNPNLHLVPRCGAKTRSGCPCKAPAVHGKLRCRMHGGRSTGPRSPEGLARIRTARTKHGKSGAEARAQKRFRLTVLRRVRVGNAASRYQDHLPPAFVARLYGYAPELTAPPRPTGGITAEQDRVRRRAVAAALAPWKQAIAAARQAERAARAAARLTKPRAPVGARPSRATGVSEPFAPIPGAAAVPEPCAPIPGAAAVPKPFAPIPAAAGMPEPFAPIPGAAGLPEPFAPIPGATDPAATARADYPPAATAAAPAADAAQGRRPTPPRPAPENPLAARVTEPLAPNRTPTPSDAGAPQPLAPIPGPAEPAIPPGLPNRAARRRWKRQQRLLRRAPAAGTRA